MKTVVHYHTKLHYSQTHCAIKIFYFLVHYHTKLHYSQTPLQSQHLCPAVHYHTKLHYSQTSKQKNCRVSRKCHYNIVTSYYLISLHIQMNFARVFINNYSFRILFYHIRLSILHQKYANLLIMHIFIKFFNLILCQIRK